MEKIIETLQFIDILKIFFELWKNNNIEIYQC